MLYQTTLMSGMHQLQAMDFKILVMYHQVESQQVIGVSVSILISLQEKFSCTRLEVISHLQLVKWSSLATVRFSDVNYVSMHCMCTQLIIFHP